MNTLFLGYGNPDRQDDGVAWHVLRGVAAEWGLSPPDAWEDDFPSAPQVAFRFDLQLTPEMAEELCGFERVCFVDAHTGGIEQDVQLIDLEATYKTSPFTHHLTPEMLLALCLSLYGKTPRCALLSVRGYEFGFETALSERTAILLPQAIRLATEWAKED